MSRAQVSGAAAGPAEHHPLLPHFPPPRPRRWAALRTHLAADVARARADRVLLLCYGVTGLLDSAATSLWGAFVSMQTGKFPCNTVYLGLGLASPHDSTRWIKSAASLLAFCVGSCVFSRVHRACGVRRRAVLVGSFAVQAAVCAAAVALMEPGPAADPAAPLSWRVLLPIALIAFQSSAQAVLSRALRFNALTSVVLTSVYCDLFSDAELFAGTNPDRNRRSAAPLLLLAGAVVGGCLTRVGRVPDAVVGVEAALWVAVGLKLLIAGIWFFWPAQKGEVGEEEG